MSTYKAPEDVRRTRLKALQTAQWHVKRAHTDPDARQAAAEELMSYDCFAAAQVAAWLGVKVYSLEGGGRTPGWGITSLKPEQFDMAIALAKEGLAGEKPKTLIYDAHGKYGMSFDVIGGLLGVHKNVVRRIVRRIDGERWS